MLPVGGRQAEGCGSAWQRWASKDHKRIYDTEDLAPGKKMMSRAAV